MAHIQYVDSLIREYMLFRGFSNSLKTFDSELKTDKDKGFRVDKIIEQILSAINTQDLQLLREIWNHLDGHLFNKLEHSFASAVKKLESGLLKLYLVTAFTAGKQDKITEFFTKLAPELHSQSEWREWFCKHIETWLKSTSINSNPSGFMKFELSKAIIFPFCKNPDENAVFAVCFTKQWQDTLLVSLHNFLATIFQCMPQPTLTRIHTEATQMKKLQEENNLLKSRIQSMGNQLSQPSASSSPKSANTSTTHQSRRSTFNEQKRMTDNKTHMQINPHPNSLNDVIPFYIPPPPHLVDDFYIIAQETLHVGNMAESQARSLRSLIRNISSGASPVMGRKESLDRGKKRSGSAGSRSWNLH